MIDAAQDGPEPIVFTPIAPHTATVRGLCPEAHITLRDPETLGLAEILISLRGPDGFTLADRQAALDTLEDGSPAWWEMMNTFPGRTVEQGGFATIADGIRLIAYARRLRAVPPIAEQIAAAGFTPDPACPDLWLREVGRRTFRLAIKPGHVILRLSRHGRHAPAPLLRLMTHHRGPGGQIIPTTWPSYLRDQAVHVALACRMVEDILASPVRKRTRIATAA